MNKLLYDKLASVYFWLFTVNALSNAVALAFLNSEWSQMSSTTKFITIVLILQTWTGTMLAFVNKAANRVAKDEPFVPIIGDTTIITKQQINEKTNP